MAESMFSFLTHYWWKVNKTQNPRLAMYQFSLVAMTKYPEQFKRKGQSIYLAHSLSVQFIIAGKSRKQGLKGAEGERIASSVQLTSMDSVQDHSPCNSVTMGKARLHTSVTQSPHLSQVLAILTVTGTYSPSILAIVLVPLSHGTGFWEVCGSLSVACGFSPPFYRWCSLPLQSLQFCIGSCQYRECG